MRPFAFPFGLCILAACATGYHPRDPTGGFSETQLAENVFQVRYSGNAYTSGEQATDFTLLRSAELARQHGYIYFVIVQRWGGYSYETYTSPARTHTEATATTSGDTTRVRADTTTRGGETTIYAKPSTMNTIVCYYDRPKDTEGHFVYNVGFLMHSLMQKYGLHQERK